MFYKSANHVRSYSSHTIESHRNQSYSWSPGILPIDGKQRAISIGFTFNGTAALSYYFNGSTASAIPFIRYTGDTGGPLSVDRYQCLILGRSNTESRCLNGTMQCYGMSLKILSDEEFQHLEKLCDD